MQKLADTFEAPEPPAGWPPPLRALWWLKKGGFATGPAWDRAHAICQAGEGTPAYDRVHALAHWVEGDRANSDYWYRRAGASPAADLESDWAEQVAALAA